ncbi:P-loop containing nucleoside triphosphate hydrolase protein [Dioscorea alata]|uniref:P-loop containing nucleoside triphosphate hydrolase protein n=1 Tax=Dioscorea alata TaxID=55571 RepID=A0ACB7UFA3_DIOAL|nr:P-loop containing nucleoside triphosphate hydrolase protein [Dioscorea alata]
MESASVSGNKEGIEVEDVWSDLHTLKKLYGLLQRTDGVMTLQGECLNIMDEKSRQLLKKLLDVATQEAIQCHSKIISKSLELVNQPEKTKEEPKTNPSIDILEGKTQEAEKQGKAEAKKACKRAELKHQRSDKKMKTGSDLKPRKRSEHPLPDVHRHRARNQPSSSGDPNRLRPSGSSSSLMRNPSQLGRSSKRTRVEAPVRTRQVLRPVDELTRHRRVGETNSVQSQLSHRRDRGSKLSGTSPSLVRKRLAVAPFQPKTEKKDSSSRDQIIRVKPMRQYYSSRSDSTFTGTRSTSESDDTVSRRRVPMLVHSEKRRSRRSLSQHKRVSPTRRSTSKEKKKGGRLKRLKDKLAVIFHHHHHHHHYHHNHHDEEVEVHRNHNNNNHASPWRYLRRMVRRRSKGDKRKVTTRTRRERVAERVPGQQQRLGFLHVLLDAFLRHVWGTQQRLKAQAKWRRLGNAGKKPHWWQLFKRRAVGLKLANRNKPRLKLGFRRSHTRRKLTNINI